MYLIGGQTLIKKYRPFCHKRQVAIEASQQLAGHPVTFGVKPNSQLARFGAPTSVGQFLLASVQAAVEATAR